MSKKKNTENKTKSKTPEIKNINFYQSSSDRLEEKYIVVVESGKEMKKESLEKNCKFSFDI